MMKNLHCISGKIVDQADRDGGSGRDPLALEKADVQCHAGHAARYYQVDEGNCELQQDDRPIREGPRTGGTIGFGIAKARQLGEDQCEQEQGERIRAERVEQLVDVDVGQGAYEEIGRHHEQPGLHQSPGGDAPDFGHLGSVHTRGGSRPRPEVLDVEPFLSDGLA